MKGPHDVEKRGFVIRRIRSLEAVEIALSGGVDSAVLLRLAVEALGRERVDAVTGDSPALAREDLAAARAVAAHAGVRHAVVPTLELRRDGYRANDGRRCYHCRRELFEVIRRLAGSASRTLAYGAIADDDAGDRPGMRAADELGVRAPLREAGVTKEDVRAWARESGLPVADRPSNACLASRIPRGTPVSERRLRRIERAEKALQGLGFSMLRVRDHGPRARVELDPAGLERAAAGLRGRIERALAAEGFREIALAPYGAPSAQRAEARGRPQPPDRPPDHVGPPEGA